jgi:hypothetical protein
MADNLRIKRVTIVTVSGDVAISWEERQSLLAELGPVASDQDIVRVFEAATYRRPVILEADQRRRLRLALSFLRSDQPLSRGLADLYAALASAE